MENQQLTKKEKRALAKEKKRKKVLQIRYFSWFKKFLIWFLILSSTSYLILKAYKYFTSPIPEIVSVPIEIYENDWIRGDADAEVTLLMYEDFQCPSCAFYVPIIRKLLDETSEKLRVVFRHFPLVQVHKNAYVSSIATEAAGAQGKFWEMHDLLYENQKDWTEESNPKEKFLEYAKQIEIDVNKFTEDYELKNIRDKIETDISSGKRLNINTTPTFFLNGKSIQPRSYEDLKEMVDSEIRGYTLD